MAVTYPRSSKPIAASVRRSRAAADNTDGASLPVTPPVARQLIRDYGDALGWGLGGTCFGFALSLCGAGPRDPLGETAVMRGAYAGMPFVEPSVKAPLLSRLWGVASQDWDVAPAEPGGPREQEIAAAFKHCLTNARGGLPQLVWELGLPSAIEGKSLTEIVFHQEVEPRGRFAGLRMVRAFKSKPPAAYKLQTNDFGDLEEIKGSADGVEITGGDLRRFVLYTPLTLYGDVDGVSDLRAAYDAYARKQDLWKLRQFFLDKLAGPFLVGKVAVEDQRAVMKAALHEARGCGFVVLKQGEEVDNIDLVMGQDDAFKSAIDDCDRDMMIAVGGAHLPFREGDSGDRRGNSQVQGQVADLWAWQLSYAVTNILNTQVVSLWLEENFAGTDPPRFVFGGVDRNEQSAAVEQVAKLNAAGYPLSKKQIAERTGWVEPKDEADVLAKPAPAPVPGQPGGGDGADQLFDLEGVP